MRKSPLLPIFLIVLVNVLGLTIILPLLPFYAERYGASAFVVTLLVASFAACQLVSGPMLGRASDRVGRRPLLLVSQVGTLVGFGILASAQALWMIFLSRVIDGMTAGNLSLAQAYISDVTTPENRARSFGIIGIAFGLGFLVGPAVSGWLSVAVSLQAPIYAAMALSATSIAATWFLLPSDPPRPDGAVPRAPAGPVAPGGNRLGVLEWGLYADYFRRPGLGPLLVQFFLFAFAFSTFMSGFALFAERRLRLHGHAFGPREVGYLFAYAGFLGIILQGGLIGRMVKRFGEPAIITSGFVSLAAGYGTLAFTRHLPQLAVAATLSAYGTGALRPALTSLVTQRVGRHEQGVVLGLTQSLMSVASITAPPLAGVLINRGLLTGWGLVAASAAVLGLVVRTRTGAPAAPVASG